MIEDVFEAVRILKGSQRSLIAHAPEVSKSRLMIVRTLPSSVLDGHGVHFDQCFAKPALAAEVHSARKA